MHGPHPTQEEPQLHKATSYLSEQQRATYLYRISAVSQHSSAQFISFARQPFPPPLSGSIKEKTANGRRRRRNEGIKEKSRDRRNRISSYLSSLPSALFFPPPLIYSLFLGKGFTVSGSCAPLLLYSVLEGSQPRCTPSIPPIELPALVINSEPCAVTAGLCTQQLATGRQALFHSPSKDQLHPAV